MHVHPQGGRGCECDLTWNHVDEAIGASEALRGRNFPRRAHIRHARNSAPNVVENDLGSDNEGEGEDEEGCPDPYDDADVTDCEDDPNEANESGEDMEADNIPGEFDDDYRERSHIFYFAIYI